MFLKELSSITLANEIADRLFDNITASSFSSDKTFAATLRAVLHKRLPSGETLHVSLVPIGYGLVTSDLITEQIRRSDYGHSYSIFIVYPNDRSFGQQMLENVRSGIGAGKRYLGDYAPQEDLRMFYIKMLNGLFYTNDHSAIIFADSLDIRRFHALQMMLPKYLPGLFAENSLTADETALLKSLGGRSHGEYERLIEQFAQRFDMRGEMIRTRLRGFETVFERAKLDEIARDIETRRHEYTMHMDNLRRTANAIQDLQITLAGLQCRLDDDRGESELMEYFLCNKNLSIIRVQGAELEFVVHGYVDIYDEEALERYLDNPGSYLYKRIDEEVTKESLERFYRAVFLGRTLKLRICAAYKANMRNSITPIKAYIFPPESGSYIPNPHIQRHGCIGGYYSRFMEYMQKRDYVGAIDQAAVSARNLNFHDSGVISKFINALLKTTIQCIEDADGNLLTPKQAIKKLEEVAGCQSPS